MSGTRITDQQLRRYMYDRKHPRKLAAANGYAVKLPNSLGTPSRSVEKIAKNEWHSTTARAAI
ncbi:hypothetical protein AWB68_08432 [Caballeronia choica]|uniref:Uncharacterized protein n=1 Tax=Caballeronia choica TaxID=326476 RepID=A0A158L3H1_9BURK|nr:hypothetical protein AWB68_08432 [Caballeronia choica]